MKKGEYGCYITVISMYAGNAEKTPDQMKENLDTIFQNYFFGV